jgi:serine/threonine-protein kinase
MVQNRNPPDPLIGKLLADRFEILDRIGEGGMGVVYRARQVSVDRVVAIKVLNAQVAQDPQWVHRFINEAKACSKLQHPNTVRLIDFGQTRDGLLFMAMEFLDGMSLRTAIDRGGRMAPARVLKIIMQCCQSLAEAHGLGIIHRDIKPDNLFLVTLAGQPDFVKVLDFSVAKLKQAAGSAMQTQAGVVFGTPNYMSPEQGRGLPLDARSDIYALGVVAYEMLMGRPPFSSQNPMEVLAAHVRSPVPPMAGVPERVAQVVMKALAKEPGQRQQNVEGLEQESSVVLAELSGGVQMPGRMSGNVPAQMPAMQPPPMMQQMPMQQRGGYPGQGMGPPPPAPDPNKTMIAPSQGVPMAPQQQMRPMPPPMQGMPPMQPQMQPHMNPQMQPQMHPQMQPQMQHPMQPQMQHQMQHPMQQQMHPQMQAHMQPATQPQMQGRPMPGPQSPQGTVLLQPSDGVVSIARQSDRVATQSAGGASMTFWIICIVCGIGIGVVAYVIVSAL